MLVRVKSSKLVSCTIELHLLSIIKKVFFVEKYIHMAEEDRFCKRPVQFLLTHQNKNQTNNKLSLMSVATAFAFRISKRREIEGVSHSTLYVLSSIPTT